MGKQMSGREACQKWQDWRILEDGSDGWVIQTQFMVLTSFWSSGYV
jgi:hypothetical protein